MNWIKKSNRLKHLLYAIHTELVFTMIGGAIG